MGELFFWPSAFCKVNNDIWFVYGKVALLCRYSIRENKTYIIDKLPVNDMFKECLFFNMCFAQKKIFLFPCWADEILVYDIQSEQFRKIFLHAGKCLKICKCFVLKKRILCIPYEYPYIFSIDISSLDIKIEYDVSFLLNSGVRYFNDSILYDKDKIYMVSNYSSGIWEYNFATKKMHNIEISNVHEISSLAKVGNRLVMCSNPSKSIYICDSQLNVLKSFWLKDKELLSVHEFNEGHFWIDDYESEYIGVFDTEGTLVQSFSSEKRLDRQNYHIDYGGFVQSSSHLFVYFNNANESFMLFDKDNCFEYESFRMLISQDNHDQIHKIVNSLEFDELVHENVFFQLGNYLEKLVSL